MISINFEDLKVAISHINDADRKSNSVDKFESLFKALDVFTNAQHEVGQGVSQAIRRAVNLLIREGDQLYLLRSGAVLDLASLRPWIMDHNELRTQKFHYPNIPESVRLHTSMIHQRLNKFVQDRHGSIADTMHALISVLYLVRSNNAHGEKTPNGPDLDKTERDQSVCAACLPVMNKLIHLLLDHPSRRLLTYGTLQPGGVNARLLLSIPQDPNNVSVRGTIKEVDGLRYFSPNHRDKDPDITCHIYESDALISLWPQLDRFEGNKYQRILIPFRTANGELGAAYIYAGFES
jgi:gamma-glutamylcyclotransferase (GGCT)/AIG2-like uncharacterized protein YtfP